MGLVLMAVMDNTFEVLPHPGLDSPGSGLSPLENDPNPLRSVHHPQGSGLHGSRRLGAAEMR